MLCIHFKTFADVSFLQTLQTKVKIFFRQKCIQHALFSSSENKKKIIQTFQLANLYSFGT